LNILGVGYNFSDYYRTGRYEYHSVVNLEEPFLKQTVGKQVRA